VVVVFGGVEFCERDGGLEGVADLSGEEWAC
jgi:hypothetical protein